MEGIVLFYKPKEITSYEVVRKFKELVNENHIGHGGTLDPLAEGLLILGIGRKATKRLSRILKNTEKEYEAVVKLGAVSETYDAEGPIVEQKILSIPTYEEIKDKLKIFIGEIYQTPPLYSAVKIKGKPAYERIRKGEKIELKPKKVFIKSIEILGYESLKVQLRIIANSGVYIRSLAHDLGQVLGCGAYLYDLKRTRINSFNIEKAISFKDLENDFIELKGEIFGKVQGVGFRFFALKEAKKLDLKGYVSNTEKGSVEVLAQGKEKSLQEFIKKLKKGPLFAQVNDFDFIFQKPTTKFSSFFVL